MSVIRQSGEKITLPRKPDVPSVWREYAGENPVRWKGLACLVLGALHGWPVERIGLAIGHHKGHVTRLIERTRRDLEDLAHAQGADAPRDLAAADHTAAV